MPLIFNTKIFIFFLPNLFFIFFSQINYIKPFYIERKKNNRGNCFLIDKNMEFSFDLNNFSSEFKINITNPYTPTDLNQKLLINFCYSNLNENSPDIQTNRSLLRIITNNITENLYNYSFNTKFWRYNRNNKTLAIKWVSEQNCFYDEKLLNNSIFLREKKIKYYLETVCNENLNYLNHTVSLNTQDDLMDFILNKTKCKKILKFQSKFACPKDSGLSLYIIYSKYSFIFGLCYIISGFFILSCGNFFESTIFYFNGILFSRMIIINLEDIIFKQISIDINLSTYIILVLFILEIFSFIPGIIIGYYSRKYIKSKILMVGVMTGHSFGTLIWLYICHLIKGHSQIFYYIFHLVIFVFSGVLSFKYLKKSQNFLILSSAIIGSYITIKVYFFFKFL